jgi:hypothetical protein
MPLVAITDTRKHRQNFTSRLQKKEEQREPKRQHQVFCFRSFTLVLERKPERAAQTRSRRRTTVRSERERQRETHKHTQKHIQNSTSVEGGLGESAASTIACNDIRRPRKDSIASGKLPFLACKKEVGDFTIPVTGFLMASGAQGFGPCASGARGRCAPLVR